MPYLAPTFTLRGLLTLLYALVFSIHLIGQSADKPNLIYILTDDQGYGDVSALNPEGKIPTPHTDRLAHEGMIFVGLRLKCTSNLRVKVHH
ncbi:MAG: hypothetical protein ACPGN3_15695, partial [Opitutales bacterium]